MTEIDLVLSALDALSHKIYTELFQIHKSNADILSVLEECAAELEARDQTGARPDDQETDSVKAPEEGDNEDTDASIDAAAVNELDAGENP